MNTNDVITENFITSDLPNPIQSLGTFGNDNMFIDIVIINGITYRKNISFIIYSFFSSLTIGFLSNFIVSNK